MEQQRKGASQVTTNTPMTDGTISNVGVDVKRGLTLFRMGAEVQDIRKQYTNPDGTTKKETSSALSVQTERIENLPLSLTKRYHNGLKKASL